MSSPSEVSDLVNSIVADVRVIISDEIALAKAEIKPSIKRAGIGSGLFGAAGYFAISATIVLWFTIAAGFAWLYASTTRLSPWACVFWGTLMAVFLLLVAAAVFVFLGGKSFSRIKAPEKTPESVGKTIAAVLSGVDDGNERVREEVSSPDNSIPRPVMVPVGGHVVLPTSREAA
ncbi:MAG: phage holin family protein [Propionibacteriaceae bacterium]|nr:phage holin family protein [Propionibacteriaceae bacterium]